MRVAVTGTPGTGKTTATEGLLERFEVVHLNDIVRDEGLSTGTDESRDSLVADLQALERWLDDYEDATTDGSVVVVDSHLAHHLEADRVVVLRCAPEILERRLEERDDIAAKVYTLTSLGDELFDRAQDEELGDWYQSRRDTVRQIQNRERRVILESSPPDANWISEITMEEHDLSHEQQFLPQFADN